MKTIKEFVEELNEDSSSRNKCTPFDYGEEEEYNFYIYFGDYSVVMFDKEYDNYYICKDFYRMLNYYQQLIVEYLANTDKTDWFPEKKYNIIIGESRHPYYYQTAYQKCENGRFMIQDAYDVNFASDEFQFTEKEIEELKATLPANMASIVDLGKVEVK